jgi:mRNA interferase MazF
VQRGDIYWADLTPRSGSEQRGRRPVVIVSHNGFNQTPGWRSIIVVPISTSAAQTRRGPTAVYLPEGAGGLERASVALCHQVTTLDRVKLTQRLGTLSHDLLNQVENGLKAALDLT